MVLTAWRDFFQTRRRLEPASEQELFLPELSFPFSDVHRQGSTIPGPTKKRKNNMKCQNLTHILMGIICIVFLPRAQTVVPPPDGGYPNFTTAEGTNALQSLTSGIGNTGIGWRSLFLVDAASFNTGVGAGTLVLNTAESNTAVGAAAMILNLSGDDNTAVGVNTLAFNSGAEDNTALGAFALSNNDSTKAGLASNNTAVGAEALQFNTDGNPNTAVGYAALNGNLTAGGNTAVGYDALLFNGLISKRLPTWLVQRRCWRQCAHQ
jgi:hypothetical protein